MTEESRNTATRPGTPPADAELPGDLPRSRVKPDDIFYVVTTAEDPR